MGFSYSSTVTQCPACYRTRLRYGVLAAACVLLLMSTAGCSAPVNTFQTEPISVFGDITVRGNVPFQEVVLITDDNNWYLLDLSEQDQVTLMTPARARVTGVVRLGEWNGRPFTRLTVQDLVLDN